MSLRLRIRSVASSAAYVAALIAVVALTSCNYDDLTRGGDRRPRPEQCGACHVEVYEEWRASTHAAAFEGESYREITADHTFDDCLGCHVPDSIYGDGPVRPRAVGRVHGVDCVACHLNDGVLVGPISSGGLVDPHPVRVDEPLYRRSDLCGRCHEGTFAQWTAAAAQEPDGRAKRTCQECHMPAVTRTMTQATDTVSSLIVALEGEHVQRRHQFGLLAVQGFADIADLSLTPAENSAALVLTVRNRLPHALPTGDFGPRTLHGTVIQRDADGRTVQRTTLAWSARLGSSVEAFGSDTRSIPLVPGCASAEAVLIRPAGATSGAFELARTAWSRP